MSHSDRLHAALDAQALTLPDSGPVAVLRAEPSRFLDAVPRDWLRCEQSFRPLHDALDAAGHDVTPSLDITGAALVVVNLTRNRTENLGNVARALHMLAPGGTLAINGAKTDGVDSLVKLVGRTLPVTDTYVKAHGRVAWLDRPAILPETVTDWTEAARLRPNADGFATAPGMFSPDHVDPGSRLLASTFDGHLHGRVADFGAGWGWLAQAALEACPKITSIDLFEAEARALDAARINVTDPRAAFHWSDVTALGPRMPPFDTIIANPPFHQGRAAEPALGAAFIAAAARLLKPAGRFMMVANRQLPYEQRLEAAFGQWEILVEDRAYKVIRASRPKRRPTA